MREAHRNDNSITVVPKTGKAGVFEKERNLGESEQKLAPKSQYKSFYQLPHTSADGLPEDLHQAIQMTDFRYELRDKNKAHMRNALYKTESGSHYNGAKYTKQR